jgi:hypothetical protein
MIADKAKDSIQALRPTENSEFLMARARKRALTLLFLQTFIIVGLLITELVSFHAFEPISIFLIIGVVKYNRFVLENRS